MGEALLAFVLIFLLSSPARALDCKDGGSTQGHINDCANRAFKASDIILNQKFKVVMACLKGDDGSKQLIDAQRAWIKFRDAECKFQGSASDGGSVQPMMITDCLRSETDTRIKELDYYLTCQEGDMSCPTATCNDRPASNPH